MKTLTIFLVFSLFFEGILSGSPSSSDSQSPSAPPSSSTSSESPPPSPSSSSPNPCDEECKAYMAAKKKLQDIEDGIRTIKNDIENKEFLANQKRRNAAVETDPKKKKALEDAVIKFEGNAEYSRNILVNLKKQLIAAQGVVNEAERKLKECKEKNGIPAKPPCDDCKAESDLVKNLESKLKTITAIVDKVKTKKTDMEVLADEMLTNEDREEIQRLTDAIEVFEKEIELIKKDQKDAEAKLKECLEKNPK